MSNIWVALILTIVIEGFVLCFVLRQKDKLLELSLINVITNLVLNVTISHIDFRVLARTLCAMISYEGEVLPSNTGHDFSVLNVYFAVAMVFELIVVWVEYLLMVRTRFRYPLRTSITVNSASCMIGIGLFALKEWIAW